MITGKAVRQGHAVKAQQRSLTPLAKQIALLEQTQAERRRKDEQTQQKIPEERRTDRR